jgi:hypothetical protein
MSCKLLTATNQEHNLPSRRKMAICVVFGGIIGMKFDAYSIYRRE